MGYKPSTASNTFYPIESIAGTSVYKDTSGRLWGIKVYAIKDIWFLSRALVLALTLGEHENKIVKRRVWVEFLSTCICTHSLNPSFKIKLRRILGLSDYSKKTLRILISDKYPPDIVNAVIKLNYDVDGIEGFLGDKDKAKNDKGSEEGADWGSIVAAYFMELGVLPHDFCSMSIVQVNAISNHAMSEKHRRDVENNMTKLKNRYQ